MQLLFYIAFFIAFVRYWQHAPYIVPPRSDDSVHHGYPGSRRIDYSHSIGSIGSDVVSSDVNGAQSTRSGRSKHENGKSSTSDNSDEQKSVKKRVALLIRGQAFRTARHGNEHRSCSTAAETQERQVAGACSVCENMILPLERAGYIVDVFVIPGSHTGQFGCEEVYPQLLPMFGVFDRDINGNLVVDGRKRRTEAGAGGKSASCSCPKSVNRTKIAAGGVSRRSLPVSSVSQEVSSRVSPVDPEPPPTRLFKFFPVLSQAHGVQKVVNELILDQFNQIPSLYSEQTMPHANETFQRISEQIPDERERLKPHWHQHQGINATEEEKRFPKEQYKKNVLTLLETVSKRYEFVFIFRIDMAWRNPIDQWTPWSLPWMYANDTDWYSSSSMNGSTNSVRADKPPIMFPDLAFLGRCEPNALPVVGGLDCVNDMTHLIPGRLFPLFYSWLFGESFFASKAPVLDNVLSKLLKKHHCFWMTRPSVEGFMSGNGHLCAKELNTALQMYTNEWHESYGFLSKWRPAPGQLLGGRGGAREGLAVADIWEVV